MTKEFHIRHLPVDVGDESSILLYNINKKAIVVADPCNVFKTRFYNDVILNEAYDIYTSGGCMFTLKHIDEKTNNTIYLSFFLMDTKYGDGAQRVYSRHQFGNIKVGEFGVDTGLYVVMSWFVLKKLAELGHASKKNASECGVVIRSIQIHNFKQSNDIKRICFTSTSAGIIEGDLSVYPS